MPSYLIPENHNPNSMRVVGAEFDALRRKQVRSHIAVDHKHKERDTLGINPLHIPVELDGVVP